MDHKLKRKIIQEISLLSEVDDCVAIPIGEARGLLIQVVDYGEGKEYCVEYNEMIDGVYEPCAECNVLCDCGDTKKLLELIDMFFVPSHPVLEGQEDILRPRN